MAQRSTVSRPPMKSPPSTERTQQIRVEVSTPDAGGMLMKLVSVFHARGVDPHDLHFGGSGRRFTLSATFSGSASQAMLLRRSLRRCLGVTEVRLSDGA